MVCFSSSSSCSSFVHFAPVSLAFWLFLKQDRQVFTSGPLHGYGSLYLWCVIRGYPGVSALQLFRMWPHCQLVWQRAPCLKSAPHSVCIGTLPVCLTLIWQVIYLLICLFYVFPTSMSTSRRLRHLSVLFADTVGLAHRYFINIDWISLHVSNECI